MMAVCVDDEGQLLFPRKELYETKWRGLLSEARSRASTWTLGQNVLVDVPDGVKVIFLCVKTKNADGQWALSYKALAGSLLWLKQNALAYSPDDFRIDMQMNLPNYNWEKVKFLLDAHFRHLNLQVFSHQG